MPNLRLVKTNVRKQDVPQRGRGSSASSSGGSRLRQDKSTERRYRYPAEEIWQVSDDRWQIAESRYLLPFEDHSLPRRSPEGRGEGGPRR